MSFEIPSKLGDALAERKLILFVGAGMSMPQLPGWGALLEGMLAAGVDGRAAEILKAKKKIQAAIGAGQFLDPARLLRDGMGPRDFCDFLNKRLRSAKGDVRHQIAARLPLAAILTRNSAGGSWNNNPENARCAYRNRNHPENTNNNIGFRCAKTFERRPV